MSMLNLSADDLCKIECAIHEAIGLNNDQHLVSEDPAEKRALLANVEQYRRVLARVRMAQEAITPQQQADGSPVAPKRKSNIHELYVVGLLHHVISGSRRTTYQGGKAWTTDLAGCESAWRVLVSDGFAKEVAHSVFIELDLKP